MNVCVKLRLVSISLTKKLPRSDKRLLSNGSSVEIVCAMTVSEFGEVCFAAIWPAKISKPGKARSREEHECISIKLRTSFICDSYDS